MIPASVLRAVAGAGEVEIVAEESLGDRWGVATGDVTRIRGRGFSVVRKRCRPVREGRHASGAGEPRHWAYWRREVLAYAAGVLPGGPGLRAPRCYGVVGDDIYLEDVEGEPEAVEVAAERLGRWQSEARTPAVPWLAGHQLAQRIAVSDLDWGAVDADPRFGELWGERHRFLAELERIPAVLSHGDFHRGNLIAAGDGTVAVDWAAFGLSPVGADLAHLALSSLADPFETYRDALSDRSTRKAALTGYRLTLVLTGVGRMHWMLERGYAPVPGFAEFVLGQAP